MMKTGVYIITNSITGKVYVGSTSVSFNRRWREHKNDLRKNKHYNDYLQNAWNKYGELNFVFSTLELCTASECFLKEQYWMDFYQSYKRDLGYNISTKANAPFGFERELGFGCKLPPVFVFKIDGTRIGEYFTTSHAAVALFNNKNRCDLISACLIKDKLSYQGYVFSHTDEFPGYIRKKNPGRGKWSEESKKKLSKTRTGKSNSGKAIEQWKNNKLIKLWTSAQEVQLKLGISKTNVSFTAKGKRLSAGGYQWKFKI